MNQNQKLTKEELALRDEIIGKLNRHYGRTLEDATPSHLYKAVSLTLRDKIMEKWTPYRHFMRRKKEKEVYYLSFEFLMGRSLSNNLLNMGMTEEFRHVVESLGLDLNTLIDVEQDAGLGNGGLGRLAACFIDSLATLDLPAYGCSIRYEYGLFKQKIIDGQQVEVPDPWLEDGTMWEIARPEEQVEVKFGGTIRTAYDDYGKMKVYNDDATTILAIPYDVPVSGYHNTIVNTLRLWQAKSPEYMDMGAFSGGDYVKAVEQRALAETLSKVLYPEDNHPEGKALRLKQQYFFVSATVQWIVQRFIRYHGHNFSLFPEKVAIHINDTHPTLAIPELMRILMDQECLGWDEAWDICQKTFAYTNHTIMSEALEKWPMDLFQRLLPRIWMIVDEINNRLVASLKYSYGEDWGKINYMSVIAHGYVSMANLCLCTCHAVNGVSKLHTDILCKDVFRDYYYRAPEKFHAITNGITFRRWLRLANPELSQVISDAIGEEWITDSAQLKKLEAFATDTEFQKKFAAAKLEKKKQLAAYIKEHNGVTIDPTSIFDVQVKRLHEYKRQLLNVLHILYLYNKLKIDPGFKMYPRTFIFGAKAAPGYKMAKLIIRLINSVADMINNDASIDGKIKVVFIENYSVSLAQMIIPAADVSEQISTASKEASGTGNMKFMLNGALTVGTLDGANVEMSECVGMDNIYIFGMKAEQVLNAYAYRISHSAELYAQNPELHRILDMLVDGTICPEEPNRYYDIYQSLIFGQDGQMADVYMVLQDFEDYVRIQEKVNAEYQTPAVWNKKAILNVAGAGFFSSDRTILEYNEKIWHLSPVHELDHAPKATVKAASKATASKKKSTAKKANESAKSVKTTAEKTSKAVKATASTVSSTAKKEVVKAKEAVKTETAKAATAVKKEAAKSAEAVKKTAQKAKKTVKSESTKAMNTVKKEAAKATDSAKKAVKEKTAEAIKKAPEVKEAAKTTAKKAKVAAQTLKEAVKDAKKK